MLLAGLLRHRAPCCCSDRSLRSGSPSPTAGVTNPTLIDSNHPVVYVVAFLLNFVTPVHRHLLRRRSGVLRAGSVRGPHTHRRRRTLGPAAPPAEDPRLVQSRVGAQQRPEPAAGELRSSGLAPRRPDGHRIERSSPTSWSRCWSSMGRATEAVKRSSAILKRAPGESAGGESGLGIVSFPTGPARLDRLPGRGEPAPAADRADRRGRAVRHRRVPGLRRAEHDLSDRHLTSTRPQVRPRARQILYFF